MRQQAGKKPRGANVTRDAAARTESSARLRDWLNARGPVAFLYHFYWVEQYASDLAAGIAFRLLINLFPLFTVITTLVAILLGNTTYAQEVLDILLRVFPATWQGQVEDLAAVGQNAGVVSLLTLPILLWFSTTLLESIGHAFFQHYGIPRQRTLRLRGVGLVLILALSAVLMATVLISSVATWLSGEVADRAGVNMQIRNFSVQSTTSLIGYALAFLLLWSLYGRIPDLNLRRRDTWRGALFAATLFVGALQLFPLYLRFRPASVGGATISFIFLLTTWLYLLAHILLLGNAFNAFRWRRRQLLPTPGGAGIVTGDTPPHGG